MRNEEFPFDLWSLQIFMTVCETGSMAAASRDLGLTQPAVTQSVAEIEARLGAKLFDRSVRPIALTQSGEFLRQRANFILAEVRQVAPLIREAMQARLASLRVGMVDSLMHCLLPEFPQRLAELAEQIGIYSGLTANHASALFTRRLDLILGVEDSVDIDGLERWPLFTEPYFLALPIHLPKPGTLAEFADFAKTHELVRFSARSHTGVDIDRYIRRLRLDIPRQTEFDGPYGVLSRVSAGHGFAIVTPLCVAEADLDFAKFQFAPLPTANFRRHLALFARRQELGAIPQELAQLCQNLIHRTIATKIMPNINWLTPAMFDQTA